MAYGDLEKDPGWVYLKQSAADMIAVRHELKFEKR